MALLGGSAKPTLPQVESAAAAVVGTSTKKPSHADTSKVSSAQNTASGSGATSTAQNSKSTSGDGATAGGGAATSAGPGGETATGGEGEGQRGEGEGKEESEGERGEGFGGDYEGRILGHLGFKLSPGEVGLQGPFSRADSASDSTSALKCLVPWLWKGCLGLSQG